MYLVGTCKMGPSSRSDSVVCPMTLKVHGLANLRVADASVMPLIVSGNTAAACMMIGEKCADMVIASRGFHPSKSML